MRAAWDTFRVRNWGGAGTLGGIRAVWAVVVGGAAQRGDGLGAQWADVDGGVEGEFAHGTASGRGGRA